MGKIIEEKTFLEIWDDAFEEIDFLPPVPEVKEAFKLTVMLYSLSI